ncbi:MmgE/PrpD family protein [uncultured Castellaniella sp.]|uniref:MmgE/PrpD family protein n=1 Tax=uncultured Castellaniella sp. TaxID=647907 RepID=UPI00260955CB|nr:MmgE/PrpD family protein [uncultured Castellaniella sp.]
MPNHSHHVLQLIHALRFEDLPEQVVAQARRCLLDLCGVAAAGTGTELSRIIRNHAAAQYGATTRGARMLFDGRAVSLPGMALAGAATIDSVDAHDGHVLTKGHVGVTIFPVVTALADAGLIRDGREFLAALALGYEIATRAGIALHATACDYHTSGAWNSIGAAALTARALALDVNRTREALGIAEYFGPRSQMMRCIDHPTMVKDGSGWGAMTGVSAALLAADGFTGAPAATLEDEAVTDCWQDAGRRWTIMEQYFKPYPVCRWAQPAVEAALSLARTHALQAAEIAEIRISTFYEASRLATRHPDTTEQAQYSLPFSVAAALRHGRLGVGEISGPALQDRLTWRLSEDMVISENPAYSQRFPAERWANATIVLRDGRTVQSAPHTARGDAEAPLTDAEIEDKFTAMAEPALGPARCQALRQAIGTLGLGSADSSALPRLLGLLLAAPSE